MKEEAKGDEGRQHRDTGKTSNWQFVNKMRFTIAYLEEASKPR
jgi:hypothetical protein